MENQQAKTADETTMPFVPGEPITVGTEQHALLVQFSQRALRITAEINRDYHEPAAVRALFSELTEKPIDESCFFFPPFYTDYGRNITLGKNVFLNTGYTFQDLGGITIGDASQLGPNVTLCTLNHGIPPEQRNTIFPLPIVIGRNVWIGANATVLPGVTVGDDAIISAGAMVTRDVPQKAVVAGIPARIVKMLI